MNLNDENNISNNIVMIIIANENNYYHFERFNLLKLKYLIFINQDKI